MIKRLSVLLIILCLGVADVGWAGSKTSQTDGNIYYLRADGTAANKAAATSGASAPTAMSVATHNSETFAAGDRIRLCDTGGPYKTSLIAPSSGKDGRPIVYEAAPGQHPVIDLSLDVGANGWQDLGGGVYQTKGYGRVLWEDGIPLHPATNPSCTDGNWFYQIGSGILQYKPTRGHPADHSIQTIWFGGGGWGPYGIDISNRSNIQISGLTLNRCGIGHGNVHRDSSPPAIIKNIKIYNNTINYSMWGIWSNLLGNTVEQDVEIYNNTLNYCNGGISTWTDNGPIGTQHPLRHNYHNNTINHLSMLDATRSWSYALLRSWVYTDHEGISFQDPMDCTVADNYIQCDTNENLADNKFWTRAIYFFLRASTSKTSGNNILRNRIVGVYVPAIYVSGDPTAGGYENNIYAANVIQYDGSDPNAQPFSINFYTTNNAATGMNYWVNNTINYPKANGYLHFPKGIPGYWTIENNIFVSAKALIIINNSISHNYFVFNYNNYYSFINSPFNHIPWLDPLPYIASWRKSNPQWDAHSYLQQPKLRPSDSALTTVSPDACKTGGTPIEGVTVSGGVGLLGIDGKAFDPKHPSMGAYAQAVTDDKSTHKPSSIGAYESKDPMPKMPKIK